MSHYMTAKERYQLEAYLRAKKPITWIAQVMGFCRKTIYNEIHRGEVQVVRNVYGYYRDVVEYSADKGRQVQDYNATAKGRQLAIGNRHDYAQRLEELMMGVQPDGTVDRDKRYSPASALAQARAEGWDISISVNTLYSYIYKGVLNSMTAKHLWEGPRPWKKEKEDQEPKIAHPKLPSIEQRPEGIRLRWELGHFVIGKEKTKACLLTLTERKSRNEIVRKLPDKRAATVRAAIDQLEAEYPAFGEVFKTITTDNGPEFLQWEQLVTSIHGGKRFDVYYCHSYAAWEKGTNERNNRMLRRKWPKGTDFTDVSQEDINDYVEWLNHYPRRSLGWKCPAEVMYGEFPAGAGPADVAPSNPNRPGRKASYDLHTPARRSHHTVGIPS